MDDPMEKEKLRRQLEREKGISLMTPREFLDRQTSKVEDPKGRARVKEEIARDKKEKELVQTKKNLAGTKDPAEREMMKKKLAEAKDEEDEGRKNSFLQEKLSKVKDPRERERFKKQIEKEQGISLASPEETAGKIETHMPPGVKWDPAKEKIFLEKKLAEAKDSEERERFRKQLEMERRISIGTPQKQAKGTVSDVPPGKKGDPEKEKARLEKADAEVKDPEESARMKRQLDKERGIPLETPKDKIEGIVSDTPHGVKGDPDKEQGRLEKNLAEINDPEERERFRKQLEQEPSIPLGTPEQQAKGILSEFPPGVKGDPAKENAFLRKKLAKIKDPEERDRLRRQLEKETGIPLKTPEEQPKGILSDLPPGVKEDPAKEKASLENKLAEIKDTEERERLRRQLEKETGILLGTPEEQAKGIVSNLPPGVKGDPAKEKAHSKKVAETKDPEDREELRIQLECETGISLHTAEEKTPGILSDIPADIKEDPKKEKAYLDKNIAEVKDPAERERLREELESARGISLEIPKDKAKTIAEDMPADFKGDKMKEKTYLKKMLTEGKVPKETAEDKTQEIMLEMPDEIKGDKAKEKAHLEKMAAEVNDSADRERLRKQLEMEAGLVVETPEEKAKGNVTDIPDDTNGDKTKQKAYLERMPAEIKYPEDRERLRKQLEKETAVLLSSPQDKAKEIIPEIPENIKGGKKKDDYVEKMVTEVKDPVERKRLRELLERERGMSFSEERARKIISDIKEGKDKAKDYLKKTMEMHGKKTSIDKAQDLLSDMPDGIRGDKDEEIAYLEQKLAAIKDPFERQRLKKLLEKETGMTLRSPEKKAQEIMLDIPDDVKGDKEKEKEFLESKLAEIQDPVERMRLKQLMEKQNGIRLEVMDQNLKDILSEVPDDIKGDKNKELEYYKSKVAEIQDPEKRERLQKQLDEKLTDDLLYDMPNDVKGDKEKERAYLESKLAEIKDPVERERLRKLIGNTKGISLEVPHEKMAELLAEISVDIRDDKEKERAYLERKLAEISDLEERERLRDQLDRQRVRAILAEIPDAIKGDREKERTFLESKLAEISDPQEKERLKQLLDKLAMKDILVEMPDGIKEDNDKKIAYLEAKLADIKDPAEKVRMRKLLEEAIGISLEAYDEKLEELLSKIPDWAKDDPETERAFLENKLAEIEDPIERERLRRLLEAATGLTLEPSPETLDELLIQIPDDIRGDKQKEREHLESKLAAIEYPLQREILRQQLGNQLMQDILVGIPDHIRGDRGKERAHLEAKLAEIKDSVEGEHLRKLLEKQKGMTLEVVDDTLIDLLDRIPEDIKGDSKKEIEYLESKLAEIQDPEERQRLRQQLQRLKDREKLEELLAKVPKEIRGDKERERAFLKSKLAEIEDSLERERLRRLLDKETLNDIFAEMPDDIKGDKAKEKAYLELMLANIKDAAGREHLLQLLEDEFGIYLDVPDEKLQELYASIPDVIKSDKERERIHDEANLDEIEDPGEREHLRKVLDKERLKDLDVMPDDIRGDADKERAYLERMLAATEDSEEKEQLRQLSDLEKFEDVLSDMPDGIRGNPELERDYLEKKLAQIKDPIERERLRKLLEKQRAISLKSPENKLEDLLAGMPDALRGDKAKERAWLGSQLAGITDPAERARLMKLFDAFEEPSNKKPCRGICRGVEPRKTPEEFLQNIVAGMPLYIKGDREKERAYFENLLAGITDPEERAMLRKLFEKSQASRRAPCKGVCAASTKPRPSPEEITQDMIAGMPPEIRGERERERAYSESILAEIADSDKRAKLRNLEGKRPCLGVCGKGAEPTQMRKDLPQFDAEVLDSKKPDPSVHGSGPGQRCTSEEFLQNALSNMPVEIGGNIEKERAYFESVLALIKDPVEKARLRKLFHEMQKPEDLLQRILNKMPPEVKERRKKEQAYFERVLAGISDSFQKEQLRRLLDARGLGSKGPCPGVCGAGYEQRSTPEDRFQSILSDMPPQIRGNIDQERAYLENVLAGTSDLTDRIQIRKLSDARGLGSKRPCPGVCGAGYEQSSTPEDWFQNILYGMPPQIRGDIDQEYAYFESVLAGISDLAMAAQLKKMFEARSLESKRLYLGPRGIGAELEHKPEEIAEQVSCNAVCDRKHKIADKSTRYTSQEPESSKPCMVICAVEDIAADQGMQKVCGVVPLRDSKPGPSCLSPVHICGAIKLEDRCAALIRQAQQRSAALAASSGGVFVLPRPCTGRCVGHLIPRGYLPGAALPEVIPPTHDEPVPEWLQKLEKCATRAKTVSISIDTDDTRDMVEDEVTTVIEIGTSKVSLKDAETNSRSQLELAWKKENYKGSSISDFENVICKNVSAIDLNIDLKELAHRGLKISKADCASYATETLKMEEAVGTSGIDITSRGVQSDQGAGISSSESYITAIECSSEIPEVGGRQMTARSTDEPGLVDVLRSDMTDKSQPLDKEASTEDVPLCVMIEEARQLLSEELTAVELEMLLDETVSVQSSKDDATARPAAEEVALEGQEVFVEAEDTKEKLVRDESEVEDTREGSELYETADSDEYESADVKKESQVRFMEPEISLVTSFEEGEKITEKEIILSRLVEGHSQEDIPRVVNIDEKQNITDVSLPSETQIEVEAHDVRNTSTQIGASEVVSTSVQATVCEAVAQEHRSSPRIVVYEPPSSRRKRFIADGRSEVDIVHKKPVIHKAIVTDAPVVQHVQRDTNLEIIQVTDEGPKDDKIPKKIVCQAPCSQKGVLGKLVGRICQGPCAISPSHRPSSHQALGVRTRSAYKEPCAAEQIQQESVCKAPCGSQFFSKVCHWKICSGVAEVCQTTQASSDSVKEYLPEDDESRISQATCADISITIMDSLVSCGCQADLSDHARTPTKVSRTCQASCAQVSRGNQMMTIPDRVSVRSRSCQASCAYTSQKPGTSTPQVCAATIKNTSPDRTHFSVGPPKGYPSRHICASCSTSPLVNDRTGHTGAAGINIPPVNDQNSHICAAEAQKADTCTAIRVQTPHVSAVNSSAPATSHIYAASRERSMSPHVCKASRSHKPHSRHVCSCRAHLSRDSEAQGRLYTIRDDALCRMTLPDPPKPLQDAIAKKRSPSHIEKEYKDPYRKLRRERQESNTKTCFCECSKKSGKERCTCMEPRRDLDDPTGYIVGCSCKDCSCGCKDMGSNEDKDGGPSDDSSRRRRRCRAMRKKAEREDLSNLMIHKDAEIVALRNALRAKESYCAEQRKIAAAAIEQLENIKSIVEERDDLRKKLESSQNELEELKKNVALGKPFGLDLQNEKNVYVPFLEESTSSSPVREEEIVQLEEEISNMRSGNLTPELEAKVIRKEVEVLKRYCSKLSVIQKESSHLKSELARYKDQMAKLGLAGDTTEINNLRYKLSSLNDTIKERNDLKQRVKHLEKELSEYTDLPEDIEVFKQRSLLLDEVLQDRDRLARRVEQVRGLEDEVYNLRKKATRVDEMEENLAMANKQNKLLEDELEHVRCKLSYAEIEALNSKTEGDTLRSKLVCMEHEMETFRSQNKDREMLKQERDHLKKSLDELTRMQADFDHMKHQMKSLEVLKAERDMFKSKYENLIGLECECDILRSQVERAKVIEKERDILENQVEDLENCISEQESEIRRLVCHIDTLAQKDRQQENLKDLVASIREEIDTKGALLIASEEKIATMQCHFKTSFEDIRNETSQVRLQKEQLEKEVEMAKSRNSSLEQEVYCLKCANDLMVKKMEDTEEYIERLQRALQETDKKVHRSILTERHSKDDAISTMRYELEAAREENENLQQIIKQMNQNVGDDHLQQLLSQSRIAIERIAVELNRQYEEWDCMKGKFVQKKHTTCSAIGTDDAAQQGPRRIDINKQTRAVGIDIGEQDPNLWDCNRKYGVAPNGTSKDPTQWDCNRGTEDGERRLCVAPCTTESPGDDPSQWDCKKKIDGRTPSPSGGATRTPSSDPRLWDCRQMPPTGARGGAPELLPYICLDQKRAEGDQEKQDSKAPCTCLSLGEKRKVGRDSDECNCLKFIETEPEHQAECTCLRYFGKDQDIYKELEDRIGQLERELTQANDTILKLQDRLGMADRTSAENLALRKHSIEVQDMAKEQIEELVEHLKKARAQVAELEDENAKMKKSLDDCLEEKKELLARIKELQAMDRELMKTELDSLKKEKDDMDKVIASTVVTASRRASKIEGELDEVSVHNKQLRSEILKLQSANQDLGSENKNLASRLASMTNENQRLSGELNAAKAELENLRKLATDPNLLEALRKENEELKRQINELLQQLQRPAPDLGFDYNKEMQEKEALKSIIADLENQMKNLRRPDGEMERMLVAPSDELEKMIKELTRRLEEEQKRADAAENALQNLKAADPSGLLNDEIKNLKKRVAQLETENTDLRNALTKSNGEVANLQKELSSDKNELNKMLSENSALKEAAAKVPGADASLATPIAGEDIEKFKARIAQLENENGTLKNEQNRGNADNKNMYDTINKLQNENAELKQNLIKLQNENDKMKKDMDNMINNAKRDADKILQIEKENDKLQQTIKNLEAQIDKLKKDLDATLNQARRESTGVSHLQDELAKLKQKIAQMEGENSKLKSNLNTTMDNYNNAAAKFATFKDENDRLKGLLADGQKDIASLKKQNEALKTTGNEKYAADLARAENEISNLQRKIAQLEAENARLKAELNSALDNLKKVDDADLRKKLMMLENENSKLKSNLDSALKGGDEAARLKETLDAENAKLTKDMSAAMDSLNKSNAAISQLNNELGKLRDKFKMLEAENAKLRQDLNKALDDIKKAVSDAAQARDDEAKLKQRIAQMEAENANLKKDLDEAMTDVKALQQMRNENAKLKRKVNALENSNADLKIVVGDAGKGAPAEDDSNKLREHIEMLENELKKLKDDHSRCPFLISQLNDEINDLKKKLSDLEMVNVNLQTKHDGVAGDFKSTVAELALQKDNESKLKQQIGQIQDENKKLNTELTALRVELTAKAGEQAALKDKEAKLNQKLSQLERENTMLKKDLEVAMEQLKKAEKACDQVKDENAVLKQRVAQLEAENATLKKNLDNALSEARKAGVKEDDSKLKDRLAQLESENKKLKSDLNNALDEAKKRMSDLSKARDDDNKMKQRLANLENDNARLKKELDKALADAQAGTSGTQQLKDENDKMTQKIAQLEGEINRLKKELNKALEDAKKDISGISAMQDDDAKLKQRLAQLERENAKMKGELDRALKDASGGSDMTAQLKGENVKQKNRIAQLEDELNRLRKELEASLSDPKKGVSGVGNLQDGNSKLKQRIAQLEKENGQLKSDLNVASGTKDENSKLKQKISQLESELDKLRKALQEVQEGERKAKGDLSKMKHDEQKLKQKLADLETNNSKLKQDLDSTVGRLNTGMSDVEKAKDESAKMRQPVAQLEVENTKLKKELENALNNVNSTSSELQRLKDENAQLKQKNAQLETSNAHMKKKMDLTLDDWKKSTGQVQDLLSEIQKLKQALADRDEQLAQTRKEMEKVGGEVKDKTAPLTQIADENAKLKGRIKDLENQLQKCQDSLKSAEAESKKNAAELVKIKELNSSLKKQADTRNGDGEEADDYSAKIKGTQDTMASMKEQFDRDKKNLLKRNEESIAKLQQQHKTALRELREKHDKEVAALKDEMKRLKEELERVTAERDKLKQLVEDQRRTSLDIKSKVEQVESVFISEIRKSKEERRRSKQLEDQLNESDKALLEIDQKYSEMKQRSADLEQQITKERRKSKELEKERQKEINANIQLQIEKEDLRRSSLVFQDHIEEEKKKIQEPQKDFEIVKSQERQGRASRDIGALTIQTFETANFPDVIVITSPLSDKEIRFFGKEKCICRSSFPALLDKMLSHGIESLELEELQFVQAKLNEAMAAVLQKFGQASGVIKPHEMKDKLSLTRRIAALEDDLKQKQKHAQHKVKYEKQRLGELRKTLDEEKQKNYDLLGRMDIISRNVSDKQKLAKVERYLDIIDEEKTKTQKMKVELDRERTRSSEHVKQLLQAGKSKPTRRTSDGSESLRTASLTNELMLKIDVPSAPTKSRRRIASPVFPKSRSRGPSRSLSNYRTPQEKRSCTPSSTKRRSTSPGSLAPVKDVDYQSLISSKSKARSATSAFYTDIKAGVGHYSCVTRKTFSAKSEKFKENPDVDSKPGAEHTCTSKKTSSARDSYH
ncbi:unnamed protein product [Acanthoscelides obtectus]|uniref:Uncharacterized protein n=1 Tax=Acanthoscelides obtectus TaxID=200917 RepID=A0A9P0JUQ4_ACAOB|nr:unnamed protein product [Acanthoscelides obtectus]CAK1667291.1 Daple-like protein [Acanthoscelides obtectus]